MFRRKDQEPSQATPLPTAQPAAQMPLPKSTPAAAPAPAAPPTAAPAARPPADASAGKRLIVGQGLSLSGDITACDLLVVEGSVQVTLNDTRAIEISETGRFTNGKASVEEATISGVYEGELTVRGRLLVRSTGRVQGRIRYGEIEVERGGRLSGTIELLNEPVQAPASKPAEPVQTPVSKPAEPEAPSLAVAKPT
jgi:cytoskeletal protein CcmA (bactofilin family)